ncbi:hypothetical protein AAY473_000286 [Plecturocebus cupreus]
MGMEKQGKNVFENNILTVQEPVTILSTGGPSTTGGSLFYLDPSNWGRAARFFLTDDRAATSEPYSPMKRPQI